MSAALWQVWAWAEKRSTDALSSSSHSHRRQRRRFRSMGFEAVPKAKPPLAFYALARLKAVEMPAQALTHVLRCLQKL
jgi:hypothetical protein